MMIKMVMNKNSMGYELNKKMRKKLIYLYEEYLKDRNNLDSFFTESAVDFDKSSSGATLYSETVNFAMNATWNMQEELPIYKKMTLKEAKEILESLKKEDEEDKEK